MDKVRVDHISNLARDLAVLTREHFRSLPESWRAVHRALMEGDDRRFESTRYHAISVGGRVVAGSHLEVVIDFETGELLTHAGGQPASDAVVLALALELHWYHPENVLRRVRDGSFVLVPTA